MARASEIRQRLIVAAERLFAENGIDGASLRQIAAAAGFANNSAVQYHFGSKDGLLDAVFRYRMNQMEGERGELLVAAASRGLLGDVKTLLQIICLPHLGLVDENGRHPYARFLCQYLLRHRPPAIGWVPGTAVPDPPENLRRVQELLRERLFYLPAPIVARRLVTATIMYLSVLINHEAIGVDVAEGEGLDQALDDTIDQMVASLSLPRREAFPAA
ncbi:TetR/AcrR family transcriptional regulator [Rhizorhabdus histidinilytica]|uniref:TetR/AcrR family transcriptional regulator n=1 Tax=Rhizorhabdus histidinilytica TaxID=439228 RepID=UPI001CC1F423|nr:TetR/AcrR family transcriptional regulator [Rhizorhabdus histidinilytica]